MRFASSPVQIFAYGSLMAVKSLRETLPDYDSARHPPLPARLRGFRKSFSAVQANCQEFATESGAVPPLVGYLNVEPVVAGEAHGVLLEVTPEQFRRLQGRETGYEAIDVTQVVEPLVGAAGFGRVLTFSCPVRPEVEQGEQGEIGIGADYEAVVLRACEEMDRVLSRPAFGQEWRAVCQRHAHWPRLMCSNPRTGGAYP